MFNPCAECDRRFGKQCTQICDNQCRFAHYVKILEKVLLASDGCLHCKYRDYADTANPNWCSVRECDNYEAYQLDLNKLIKDYGLKDYI